MHFVRPEAFLLLLAWLPFVFSLRRQHSEHGWKQVIEPQLLAAFSMVSTTSTRQWHRWLLPISLLLAIIALAGPALPTNNQQTAAQGNLYVVLDNSYSMAAEDVSPDRLTRAKHMIQDWTQSALFSRVSVITYSGSAHLVTPLTRDSKTMMQQLSSLHPFMMPMAGNRAELAFKLLKETLKESGDSHANILWFSDDIASNKMDAIREQIPEAASLTFVPVGTEGGSPIPLPNNNGYLTDPNDHSMVLVKADTRQLANDARALGFDVTALGADPVPERFETLSPQQISQQGYKEFGYFLLIPIALLWLFQQKRGVSFAAILGIALMYPSEKTYAGNWFQNQERQAFEALAEGDTEKALLLSENPMIAGQAEFQAGHYDKAVEWFSQQETIESQFNQANTLVHQQKFQQALKLYDAILAKQAHEGAKQNKALVEAFLKNNAQQQSQNSSEQQQDQQNGQQNRPDSNSSQNPESQSDQSQQQQQQQQQGQQSTQSDEQQSGEPSENEDQPDSEQSQGGKEQTEEDAERKQAMKAQDNSQEGQVQSEQARQQDVQQTRQEQEVEAILNQLENPNSSVLQQKFQFQFQQNPTGTDSTLW